MVSKRSIVIIARVIFISCPAILLSGYFVYKGRGMLLESKGFEVSDFIYSMVLYIVMFTAYWLTTRDILKELFSTTDNEK